MPDSSHQVITTSGLQYTLYSHGVYYSCACVFTNVELLLQ